MRKYSFFLFYLALVASSPPVLAQNDAAAPPVVIKGGTAGSYLSGQFARQSGDVEKAIHYLRRAHQNDPQNVDIAMQLQGLLLLDGAIEEAVQLARRLPADTQKDSLTLLLLCLDAAKRGDLDTAKAILEEAAPVSTGQLWLPLVSAWVEVGRNNFTKPLETDSLSVETAGQASTLVHYHLALINAQAGFTQAAVENFRKSVADTKNPPARIMMMMTKFYDENKKPPALAPLVNAWRKDNADAHVAGDVVSSFTPQDGIAEVLFTMGTVVQSAGSPQDAIIYYNMARYAKPEFQLAAISLGDAYSDLRQFGKANAIYGAVQERSAFYGRAQLRMAMNENQVGRWETAISMLDALAKKLPAQYEPLVAKGDLLRTHQNFSEAIEAYTLALKRIGKAESYHWPIFFARGVCYERQRKWAEAESDLRQALTLRPDQPDVMNYLGYSWLMQSENLDEAYRMIEKAAVQRPNDPQIADSMGWALYMLARYDEAVSYLEKALEAMPNDPTINDHLGDVYWKLGRKTEARYQWERSLTFSPDPREAAIIERKLKDGLAENESRTKQPVVAESQGAVAMQ